MLCRYALIDWRLWDGGVVWLKQKGATPLPLQELLLDAEKVKPAVLLPVGIGKGIQPVKLHTKTPC